MTTIALFGAGGKMGYRLPTNFKGSRYRGPPCRGQRGGPGAPEGRPRLRRRVGRRGAGRRRRRHSRRARHGDRQGRRRHRSTSSKPGTMVVVLDAAAPFAGHLPKRDRSHLFRHPSLPSADLQRRDGHGGQAGLFRRRHGQAAHRQRADAGARRATMPRARRSPRSSGRRSCARTASPSSRWRCWSPACRRPCAPRCSIVMREAMDEVVRRGVPQRGRARLPARPHERARRRHLRARRRACFPMPATRPSSSASRC